MASNTDLRGAEYHAWAAQIEARLHTIGETAGWAVTGGQCMSGSYYVKFRHPESKPFRVRVANHKSNHANSRAKFNVLPGTEERVLADVATRVARL